MTPNLATAEYLTGSRQEYEERGDSHSSGVSWGAVIGGAFVAAAVYLILLALGAGLGLSAISPWSNAGISASAAGIAAVVWLIFVEIIASALGGYLTGRLRTRWVQVHTDEVYFRDTANGFLAWAFALVITVTFLATAATSMVGGIAQREVASPTAATQTALDPNAYYVDKAHPKGRVRPNRMPSCKRKRDGFLRRLFAITRCRRSIKTTWRKSLESEPV